MTLVCQPLQDEVLNHPVVKEFLEWNDPVTVKKLLETQLLTALTSQDADAWNFKERSRHILLYKQLCSLTDAIFTKP